MLSTEAVVLAAIGGLIGMALAAGASCGLAALMSLQIAFASPSTA